MVEASFDVAVASNVTVGFSHVRRAVSHAQDSDFKANVDWKF